MATCAMRAREPVGREAERRAAAVDLLEDGGEALLDAGGETEPPRGERGDLAVGPRIARGDLPRPGRRDSGRARPAGQARVRREVRQVHEEHVVRAREVGAHRGRLDGDLVAAEKTGRLVGVRGAADVLQERRVVHVRRLCRAEIPGDRDGDHRRAGGLAGLEPHAGVGGEREPHQERREPHPGRRPGLGDRGHVRIQNPRWPPHVTSHTAGGL